MARKILQLDGSEILVSTEARFDSERALHDAIAAHPEVLPSADLGLGELCPLGTELDFGHGPIDLLCSDPDGQIVIVEFKRGTENPDVRRVVAQVLDYGASLWRVGYDELDRVCTGANGGLADLVAERCAVLDVPFDPDSFRRTITTTLDSGEFVFLYVGRDLDDRTRRIMTYLAEGPRMSFFAVEVDYFRAGSGSPSTLVPRTAFVPSWVAETSASESAAASLAAAPPAFHELLRRMDGLAAERGLMTKRGKTGFNYGPRPTGAGAKFVQGVGVYSTGRGAELNLGVFRDAGRNDLADDILARIAHLTGSTPSPAWPSFACAELTRDWDLSRAELLDPYFDAREQLGD